MSNTRGSVAYELEFFTLICDNLIQRRGTLNVAESFGSLLTLASLPWLDQPHFLEPGALIGEIHDAWEELWTVQAVGGQPAASLMQNQQPERRRLWHGQDIVWRREATLGMYLARPLHKLAAFAASGAKGTRLRVGTHRRLIVDPEHLSAWRVIQGGAG